MCDCLSIAMLTPIEDAVLDKLERSLSLTCDRNEEADHILTRVINFD